MSAGRAQGRLGFPVSERGLAHAQRRLRLALAGRPGARDVTIGSGEKLPELLESQERKTEAAKWYDRAATQGNKYAQYRLARLGLTGNGMPKDAGRAVELLEAFLAFV
ncbi:MAG: sel1 repeat family protein [Ruminococcaceae bacterium]|nr:sel1 repeat family protein [Oscillospiraceae bacterium]